MHLGRAHFSLKLGSLEKLAEEIVRRDQNVVIEKDVIDPDNAFLPTCDIVRIRRAAMHGESYSEVSVVIEIVPRADNPVYEAILDERDQGGDRQPRGSQDTAETQPNGDIIFKNLFAKELTGLAQLAGVVGEKIILDYLCDEG